MVEVTHRHAPAQRSTNGRLVAVAATVLVFAAIHLTACVADETSEQISFQRDVAPILEANCLRCHGDSPEGDVSLNNATGLREAGIVVPGNPKESHLLTIIQPDGDLRPAMPKEGKPLTTAEVDVLRRWIEAGSNWPEAFTLKTRAKADSTWWSLQPITAPTPPKTNSTSKNAIDHFIHAKLKEKGLRPSSRANRRTLIRRLYFDLLGLPPSPKAVADFVQSSSPMPYEQLVDELLASKHFGERWARHWLDIAHYADTHGFERDKRRDNAWRYRDWVIDAFNSDMPYPTFVTEQLAGDEIPNRTER